jgi:glutathione S-transferase
MEDNRMKLYYSPGACSLAPHIILRETGADFTLEKTDTKTKKTERDADFLAINPKGYVPVLELDDGYNLTEGVVIQEYLADRAPEAKLAPPPGSVERLKLKELLLFLTTEIHKTFSPLFAPTTPDDYKPLAREKISARFDLLEQRLSDGRSYLTGAGFTIADAYFFTLASWAQFVGIDLAKWPSIGRFMQRVAARPAVQAALEAEGLKKAA